MVRGGTTVRWAAVCGRSHTGLGGRQTTAAVSVGASSSTHSSMELRRAPTRPVARRAGASAAPGGGRPWAAGAAAKDRTVQPLLSEGDQVSALALIFGRGGPERRGHLGREV